MKAMRIPRRKAPAEPVHAVRRTDQPRPSFNYELFNCNNFNIRYWSWNYRGCWPFEEVPPDLPFTNAKTGALRALTGGLSTYLKRSKDGTAGTLARVKTRRTEFS